MERGQAGRRDTAFRGILVHFTTDRNIETLNLGNNNKTRNVTVCNKCPRKSPIMTLIPGCDLEHGQGTSLAQDVTCHFVLLFCVNLTLGKDP